MVTEIENPVADAGMEQLTSNEEYAHALGLIEACLKKATDQGGFASLSSAEDNELERLTLLASRYEKKIKLQPIEQPKTLPEMIRLKMFLMGLNQKQLAKLLDVTPSRISELLNGKMQCLTFRLAVKL